jgi:hypothetical protein
LTNPLFLCRIEVSIRLEMDKEKIRLIIKNMELLLSSLKDELLEENVENTKFVENFENSGPPVDDFDEVFDY